MNPVGISVIPGVEVNTLRFGLPEAGPLEDFSLILMSIQRDGKSYEGASYIRNSELPLSKRELEALRLVANEKLEGMRVK